MTSGGRVVVAAVAVLAIAGIAEYSTRDRADQQLFAALHASDRVVTAYDTALIRYAALRSGLEGPALCVGGTYRSDCVNVVVVDARSGAARPSDERVARLLAQVHMNALAIPPRLVVVDRNLLDLGIMGAYNAFVATVNRMRASKGGPGRDAVTSALAEASYMQFGNIAELRRTDTAAAADTGSPAAYAARLLPLFGDSLYAADPSVKVIYNQLLTVFSVLLEHEIAHLEGRSGGTSHGMFSPATAIDRALAPRELVEETRADDVAVAMVDSIIGRLSTRPEAAPMRLVYLWPGIRSLSVLAYASLLQDLAIYDGLEGFRGLRARDHALAFVHRDCGEDPALRSLDFNDPQRVLAAYRKPLPILTRAEFDTLRVRLARADRAQTHRHNFLRATQMTRALVDSGTAAQVDFRQNDYVQALLDDKPALAFRHPGDFPPIAGTSTDRMLAAAGKFAMLHPAVTCPLSRCYVGRVTHGDGFIELIGTDSALASLRLVFNTRGPRFQGDTTGRQEAVMSAYIENLARMMTLFDALASTRPNPLDELMAGVLRDPMYRCGFGSQAFRRGQAFFQATTLSEPGWMEIRVTSAAGAPDGVPDLESMPEFETFRRYLRDASPRVP